MPDLISPNELWEQIREKNVDDFPDVEVVAGDGTTRRGRLRALYRAFYAVDDWCLSISVSPGLNEYMTLKHGSKVVTVLPRQKIFHDRCPKCGDEGEWRALALVCRNGHGVFAG